MECRVVLERLDMSRINNEKDDDINKTAKQDFIIDL